MKQDFNQVQEQVHFGNDSIVIVKHIADLPGGRTLDVADFPNTLITAGHVIIAKDGEENVYKPMPLNEEKNAYATLPSGFHYVGVLYRTIQKSKPAASVLYNGVVNEACLPFKIADIKAAFSAAVPHISFIKDEEA